jgi:hypothetical protein
MSLANSKGAYAFSAQNTGSVNSSCATGLGGRPALPGSAEPNRISPVVRSGCRSANWITDGPPAE